MIQNEQIKYYNYEINKIRAYENDRACLRATAYNVVRRREVAPRSTSYALLPPYIPPAL